MRVVDAHVHFWDPDRLDYPWLTEVPALHRAYRPADLDPGGYELAGVVFVEAGRRDEQAVREVAWVEELAQRWPALRAVVAHAAVERGAAVRPDLAELAGHPLVTGVRRNVQDEPPGFTRSASFVDGVRLVGEFGFTFDLCIRHHQLAEVTDLAERLPEVTFVLDHLGKPAVRDGVLDPWRADLGRLAALPNTRCKLSGLTTEADLDRWTEADVLPYLRQALAEFGADRCMVGSDWPVATLATTYPRWLDVVGHAVRDLPPAGRDAVFERTASRVYRLSES